MTSVFVLSPTDAVMFGWLAVMCGFCVHGLLRDAFRAARHWWKRRAP